LLEKHKLLDCKPRATPCEMGINKLEESSEPADPTLYRGIVGSLIYAMNSTRPDLCYFVTFLSQFMSNPQLCHLTIAKHVLRYIKGCIMV
jgi:hypothetical protein